MGEALDKKGHLEVIGFAADSEPNILLNNYQFTTKDINHYLFAVLPLCCHVRLCGFAGHATAGI